MGRGLREAGRMLRPPRGHGPRVPGVRHRAEPHRQTDGVLLQLARLPDLRWHSGTSKKLSVLKLGLEKQRVKAVLIPQEEVKT